MNPRSLLPLLLLGFVASAPAPHKIADPINQPITGDYVEARTASVFAGACHYNGELVTEGKQALMAWHFKQGTWNGTDLSGLNAMAQVVSDANLGDDSADRKSELVVSTSATNAQMIAIADLLHATDSQKLGEMTPTRRAPIVFQNSNNQYTVKADGFGELTIHPMPNNECCSQPHLVWYTPMMPVENRKVGYTETASYTAGTLGDNWARAEENSAFYGPFSFDKK